MFIVLGIGNPDEKYADTRHNVGWMTVDALSETIGKKFKKSGFEFWAAEGRLGRHEVVLVKAWTYVNETGRVIPELRKRWGEEMMVVCDDVNLPLGTVAAACDAVRCWMDLGIDKAMTNFNRKPPAEEAGEPAGKK
jgi:PTH1 family peptidyl-tRNA hydrolase